MIELAEPQILVADPAWKFKDKLPGKGRGAEKHYHVEPLEKICRFWSDMGVSPSDMPLVLVLWRVASMQREAMTVIDRWGYEDPTSEIVWVKRSKNGNVATGLGRTVRGAHEIALICKRKGTPGWKALGVVKSHAIRSVLEVEDKMIDLEFDGPRLEHSRKPDEFYELIDELFFGPVVEVFARRQWKNWHCFGDELVDHVDDCALGLGGPCDCAVGG